MEVINKRLFTILIVVLMFSILVSFMSLLYGGYGKTLEKNYSNSKTREVALSTYRNYYKYDSVEVTVDEIALATQEYKGTLDFEIEVYDVASSSYNIYKINKTDEDSKWDFNEVLSKLESNRVYTYISELMWYTDLENSANGKNIRGIQFKIKH